ncbi:MAG: hypothetical protein H7A25_09455 [Leptospiraceae bacterium]|nr:hypothetical protein [Leptospiraceae bacterium]MCP5500116.1 hypothetical protein [Leptospiraceae bacterium]
MELFSDDKAYKEYKDFKIARDNFRESNREMTDQIDVKARDKENVNYTEVHLNIYENVGLGREWRVEKEKNPEGLNRATHGFNTVTEGLNPYPDKSISSNKLLKIILSFFGKNEPARD